MTDDFHTPVLVDDVVRFLVTDTRGVYVDGTVGGGGHAEAIARHLEKEATLIGFDADADALRVASRRLKHVLPRTILVHANIATIREELGRLGVSSISGAVLDLGVSSYQLDHDARGFSFRGDERIDMRMDTRQSLTGKDVVNEYDERRLADIIWRYGEEKNARRIARAIVQQRPLETTGELARAVESVCASRYRTKTLARVFQAIRIEVNNELHNLEHALREIIDLTAPGGRIVVISYHSLEDRIVKHMFRAASLAVQRSQHKYAPDTAVRPRLRVLTKTPVIPSETEVQRNPRARSAKLRAAERLSDENPTASES